MTGNCIDVSVGKCLRSIRFQRNRTIAELAAAIGVTPSEMLAFENGEQRIGARLMADLCQVLDVRASEFFSWSAKATKDTANSKLDAA